MTDETIFATALEQADPAVRAAYLAGACADPERRRRVEGLLTAHDAASGFLERPPVPPVNPDNYPTRDFGAAGADPGEPDEALAFLAPPGRPDSLGRIGHYEVLQVLGKGGFGIVFRAFDEILQRVVAVKVMAPQLAATSPARKRFTREARSSAQVRHENVVQVYEVGETPLPYLVMEFIPGETLQQRLDRTGPIDVPDVVRIGRQIAEGLAAAHATELIHRDIKPGNVLLEGGAQRVKITDFGLARAADDASISQSGIIAGTPMFMAPEQAKGDTLDQRADLFSLGSVLYQMVAGRPPFRANGTLAVLKRVAEDDPRPIREIIPEAPQWLCDIIAKLHAKNPADRFQSAREVADLLADCEAQLKTNAKLKDFSRIPQSKQPAAGRAGRWRRSAGLALAVPILAGVFVVGFVLLTRTNPPDESGQPVAKSEVANGGTQPRPPAPNPAPPEPAEKSPQEKWAEAFAKDVAALPVEDQMAAVEAELKKRNPELGGKLYPPVIQNGQVTRLNLLDTQNLKDITPVAALKHLWDLSLPPAVTDITPLKHLPLRTLTCYGGTGFTDLAPLKDMPLEDLLLWMWHGDDMSVLKGKKLRSLNLGGGGGKVDLTVLDGMPLQSLYVMSADVADYAPLSQLRLKNLGMSGKNITSLEPLRGMRLIRLGCTDSSVSDLGPLKGMPLEELHLTGTPAKDLSPVANAPLRELNFDFVPERDAEILRGIETLETINRQRAAEFWKRVGAPVADTDRKAAEDALSIGGEIKVNEQGPVIKAAQDLPREAFRLTWVGLPNNKQVTDAGLAAFKDCKNLGGLQLEGTPVTDAGLIHLKDCTGLTGLDLNNTKVTDAGLAHLKGCTKLTYLQLGDTQTTDAGLAHFMDCKTLTYLNMSRTQVGDAGLARLKECSSLTTLWLEGAPVTDAGLSHLTRLDKLIELKLAKTKVTAKGIEGLAKALPGCKIEWDGGVIEPKK